MGKRTSNGAKTTQKVAKHSIKRSNRALDIHSTERPLVANRFRKSLKERIKNIINLKGAIASRAKSDSDTEATSGNSPAKEEIKIKRKKRTKQEYESEDPKSETNPRKVPYQINSKNVKDKESNDGETDCENIETVTKTKKEKRAKTSDKNRDKPKYKKLEDMLPNKTVVDKGKYTVYFRGSQFDENNEPVDTGEDSNKEHYKTTDDISDPKDKKKPGRKSRKNKNSNENNYVKSKNHPVKACEKESEGDNQSKENSNGHKKEKDDVNSGKEKPNELNDIELEKHPEENFEASNEDDKSKEEEKEIEIDIEDLDQKDKNEEDKNKVEETGNPDTNVNKIHVVKNKKKGPKKKSLLKREIEELEKRDMASESDISMINAIKLDEDEEEKLEVKQKKKKKKKKKKNNNEIEEIEKEQKDKEKKDKEEKEKESKEMEEKKMIGNKRNRGYIENNEDIFEDDYPSENNNIIVAQKNNLKGNGNYIDVIQKMPLVPVKEEELSVIEEEKIDDEEGEEDNNNIRDIVININALYANNDDEIMKNKFKTSLIKKQKIRFNNKDKVVCSKILDLIHQFLKNGKAWQDQVKRLLHLHKDDDLDIWFELVDLVKYSSVKEYYMKRLYDLPKYNKKWNRLSPKERNKIEEEYSHFVSRRTYFICVVNKFLFFGVNMLEPYKRVDPLHLFELDMYIKEFNKHPSIIFDQKFKDSVINKYNNTPDLKERYTTMAKDIDEYLDNNSKVRKTRNCTYFKKEKAKKAMGDNNNDIYSSDDFNELSNREKKEVTKNTIPVNETNERLIYINKLRKLKYNSRLKYYRDGFTLFANDMRNYYKIRNEADLSMYWDAIGKEGQKIYEQKCRRMYLSFQFMKEFKDILPKMDNSPDDPRNRIYYYQRYWSNYGSFAFFYKYYFEQIKELSSRSSNDKNFRYKVATLLHKCLLDHQKKALLEEMDKAKDNEYKKRMNNVVLNQMFDDLKNQKGREKMRMIFDEADKALVICKLVKIHKMNLEDEEEENEIREDVDEDVDDYDDEDLEDD